VRWIARGSPVGELAVDVATVMPDDRAEGRDPVIFFVHLAANLDNWDPRIIDPIAGEHHVIAFDNRGIGASTGQVPDSVESMADDANTLIRALGFDRVHIFYDILRATLTRSDPKEFLFFNRNATGKPAARAFVNRRKERTVDRDAPVSVKAFQTQRKAIKKWGRSVPADLSKVTQPTLIANGDNDRMVPSVLSEDLHRRISGSELIIYPDSGHGGIFQFHDQFAPVVVEFLGR
jgi:pimeloyl-ACP methyl ester carboxylesterase